MDRAVAKRKFLERYDDKIKRPKEVKRTLNDIAAKNSAMPYGNSADGSLKLNPRAGFDDLAGSSAISPDHEPIGPFAPSMLEHVPADDPMGEVSIDAALPGRSGNATGVDNGDRDDT